ncbi:MAG: BREX system ATP-binding domain-containing protein [Methanoculleus sp.]
MTETVDHERYGTGVVEGRRYQGFELLVQFSCGIRRWVLRSELRRASRRGTLSGRDDAEPAPLLAGTALSDLSDGGAGLPDMITPTSSDAIGVPVTDLVLCSRPPQDVVAPGREIFALPDTEEVGGGGPQRYADHRAPSPEGDARQRARGTIEALRQGGVPREMVEHFTAGRDDELSAIQEWLESGDGCLRIDGDYGVGKSHMLELAALNALHAGWAVARVEIDPNETPFHKPKRLYQSIARSLKYYSGDQLHNFNDLMTFVAKSPESDGTRALRGHPYFGTFIRYWRADSDNEDLWDWIGGESTTYRNYLPRLLGYQLAANIYCNLLSGLGWIAKDILSLRGLFVLIDEAESIDRSFYSNYQHTMGLNTLKGLIFTANGNRSLIREATEEQAISRQAGRGQIGRYSGLRYPGDRQHQFSYIWREDTSIKIVLAFVPEFFESLGYDNDAYLAVREMPSLNIESLSHIDHARLLRQITDIYREAYHFEPQGDVVELLPK